MQEFKKMLHLPLIYYVSSIICIYLRPDYDCVDGVEYSKLDACLYLKEEKKERCEKMA